MSAFTSLPEAGFLRVAQIVNVPAKGDKPARQGLIPVSRATWHRGVKEGRYPQPTKQFGRNTTAWAVADLRRLIDSAMAAKEGGR